MVETGNGESLDDLKQQRDALRSAMGRVEGAISGAEHGRHEAWVAAVLSGLDELADALVTHIEATEGHEGLFAQVIDHAPRLSDAVERLMEEHTTLTAGLARAREAISTSVPVGDEAVDTVIELLAELSRHRHRGANLVWDAYNVDISYGD